MEHVPRYQDPGVTFKVLPDVHHGYLIQTWQEMGYFSGNGGPLSWEDIEGYSRVCGVPLTAWEAKAIRTMSREYLAMSVRARDPSCPPPYAPAASLDFARKQVSDMFKALSKRGRGGK